MSLADLALGWVAPPLAGAKKLAGKVPWQVWAVAGLAAAVLFYGHLRFNAGRADVQAQFDAYRAKQIGAAAVVLQRTRAAEAAQRQAFADIATTHRKEMTDAIAEGKRVAAAVRAGSLRLRDHWTCPAVEPGATADPGRADENADLRAAGAGDLVQLGREADATVRALQNALKAERVK